MPRTVTNPETAWKAMTGSPRAFLCSWWPWRSIAYVVSGGVVGLATLSILFGLVVAGVVSVIFLVGLIPLLAAALSGLAVAPLERFRLKLVDRRPTVDPHRTPPRPGLWSWLRTRLREAATWRELCGAIVLAALGLPDLLIVMVALTVPATLLAGPLIVAVDHSPGAAMQIGPGWEIDTVPASLPLIPLGVLALVLCLYALTAWAVARAALTTLLLAPRETAPAEHVIALTRSRARLVDTFEAERRRIERDLHDGAQQRLVSLTVSLGLAKLDLAPESAAAQQVTQAHDQAKLALAELRELIQGVHPQVLTDRGLPPAIADVAGRSQVPVDVDVELPARLSPEVEAAAYFVVTEALTNVAKHSKAGTASIRGRVRRGRLVVEVSDDGVGGADPGAGTGLVGLADRVAVVDGEITLRSPVGGPTVLRVEIPSR